jgi:hypothetical protein
VLFKPVEHKNDGGAMSRYAESYGYDEVGNLLRMRHENTSANAQGVCPPLLLDLNPEKFNLNHLVDTALPL